MRTFGLLGYPLSHSFSPSYFAAKFERENIQNAQYVLFEKADIFSFVEEARMMESREAL